MIRTVDKNEDGKISYSEFRVKKKTKKNKFITDFSFPASLSPVFNFHHP